MQAQSVMASGINGINTGLLQKVIVAILLWPVTLLAPVIGGVSALFALVLIDLTLGIWKAIKLSNFSSVRLRTGFRKITLYLIIIIAIRNTELLFPIKETTYLADLIILILGLTELTSILETVTILGINIPSPLLQFFKKQVDIEKIIKK